MAGTISNDNRDQIITLFRERVCERLQVTPLVHQRRWWCAADGLVLEEGFNEATGLTVQLGDGGIARWGTKPRPYGRARVIADLGSFKSGKSFGTGLWLSGFGAIPNARVGLIGLEYSIAEPEFNYVCEFLLSERGMNIKAASLINRPRQGEMFLELTNGARFEAKSWERKDALKGKENDCYVFCEAYQLPGLETFTSIRQNLVARDGYAIFPTTPDRPWVKELHDKGHGQDPDYPEWECVCGVPRQQNPWTYNVRQEVQDRSLMTTEKFRIAHHGEIGEFVGRVYTYTRGQSTFTSKSHPDLFRGTGDRAGLVIPAGWEVVCGADTGTYYSSVAVAFSPSGDAFVIDEWPNYRYIAGAPERDETLSIPEWAGQLTRRLRGLGARGLFWADPNTQFKGELKNYGMMLLPQKVPVETRTEITREYFQHGRIWFAPWLSVLPFEIENAAWPEESTASGKFARVKDRDHTLDCLEHVLAKRPYGRVPESSKSKGTWLASQGYRKRREGNIHLGKQ